MLNRSSSITFLSNTRKKRIALVAQGGGQRGIFTAGILDSFLEAGFDPFELYFGTSAGALNISSYISRQQGFAHNFITHYTTQERFFNLFKYIRHKKFMDLEWAFDASGVVHPAISGLDIALKTLEHRNAYACATNMRTLKAQYFPMFKENWLQVLKASCAIPLLYPSAVNIDNQFYVDGGVTGAIPAKEAFDRGADIIIVIRTEPAISSQETVKSERIEAFCAQLEKHLPSYLSRLKMEGYLDKLSEFHRLLARRLDNIQSHYADHSTEKFWGNFKSLLHDHFRLKDGHWLFGGDSLYRLQVLSGAKINADMLEMLTRHYQNYHETLEFLRHPPRRAQVLQIAPNRYLSSNTLLSKPQHLDQDYQYGLDIGKQFMSEHAEYLSAVSSINEPFEIKANKNNVQQIYPSCQAIFSTDEYSSSSN